MSQTAAHPVDHVILLVPVLGVVQRVLERHLRDAAGLVAGEGQGGAVTLIQSFGSTFESPSGIAQTADRRTR
jgi:hypothetical protein